MAAEMEESGAALRQLKQAGEQLRALLGEQAELKARGERVEGAKEQRWRALALLRSLKAGLRDTFLQSDEWKARVQEQKDRVEAHQLKLQNLLYEKDHLAREIRRCRGFSTKEMDKIEFEEGNLPIAVDPDVHRQHLDQLTRELATRKQLQEELKKLKAKLTDGDSATQAKQTFLDGLRDQVTAIEQSTTGLQAYMGEPVSAQLRRQQAAQQLTSPLYTLYCELEAYQTASDTSKQMLLEVVDAVGIAESSKKHVKRAFPPALVAAGNSTDEQESRPASASKRQKVTAPSRSPSSGRSSSAVAAPAPVPSRSPSQSRSKHSEEQHDNAEAHATHTAEKLLALKPLEQSTDAAKTGVPSIAPLDKTTASVEPMDVHDEEGAIVEASSLSKTDDLLHNLWVPSTKALQLTLQVASPDAGSDPVSGSFTVLFQYLPAAKIVTVEITKSSPGGFAHDHHNILMNLFPGDDGLSLPRVANNYELAAHDGQDSEVEFPASATCRPYAWAQWICGLYSLPRANGAAQAARRPEPSIRNVISQLTRRFVTALVVKKQVELLSKASNSSDRSVVTVSSTARQLFPGEPKTRFIEWKEVPAPTSDPFEFFKTLHADDEPSFHLPTTGCRYFNAMFRNGSTRVVALVEISPEYPVRAPRFLFQSRDTNATSHSTVDGQLPLHDSQLKEVEVEVNAYYDELLPRGCPSTFLLMHQMRKVQQCLDVLSASSSEGGVATLCFGRERRGKDRRHAIVMDSVSKDLRHR